MLRLIIATSGSLRERSDEKWHSQYKLVLDSGSSSSIVSTRLADYGVQVDGTARVQWSTVQGSFSTKKRAKLIFSLLAFSSSKKIQYTFHVAKNDDSLGYDMIAGANSYINDSVKHVETYYKNYKQIGWTNNNSTNHKIAKAVRKQSERNVSKRY